MDANLEPFPIQFYLNRKGARTGPFTTAELRQKVADYEILSTDKIECDRTSARLNYRNTQILLNFIEDDEELVYAEDEIFITTRSLIVKEKRFPLGEVESVECLIPEPPRESAAKAMERRIYLIVSIIFFWTIIVPVVAWYLGQKNTTEEGLGAVYGVKITGPFDDVLMHSGIGIIDPEGETAAQLENLSRRVSAAVAGAQ